MVSVTVLTNLLLASAALAAPSFQNRATNRQPNNPQYLEAPVNNVTLVQRDHRWGVWSGAVYNDGPNTFQVVYGAVTIPTISGSGSISAWVGIDGDACKNSILQTGIDLILYRGLIKSYAWYQWYPDGVRVFFDPIDFRPGHVVNMTVTAPTPTTGSAVIQNLSTGEMVTQQFNSANPLCLQDVEWVVQNRMLTPGFPQFDPIVFTGAYAIKANGNIISAGDANTIDMQQGDKYLTSSSVSAATVTVRHIGGLVYQGPSAVKYDESVS